MASTSQSQVVSSPFLLFMLWACFHIMDTSMVYVEYRSTGNFTTIAHIIYDTCTVHPLPVLLPSPPVLVVFYRRWPSTYSVMRRI